MDEEVRFILCNKYKTDFKCVLLKRRLLRLLGIALLLDQVPEVVLLILECLDEVRLVRVALLNDLLSGVFTRLQTSGHLGDSGQGEHAANGLVDSGREGVVGL